MIFSTLRRAAARFALLLSLSSLAACADSPTTPREAVASLAIAPPATPVLEQDAVTFRAILRDPSGRIVTGAALRWTVNDARLAEISEGGVLTALRAGTVRVSARMIDDAPTPLVATFDLLIVPLVVQQVAVLPAVTTLSRGDIADVGVHVTGQGGRTVLGRLVRLTSDDPSIAAIDPSGRLRALTAGRTTVRATADGVTGAVAIEVTPDDVALTLSRADGARLPRLVSADTVEWNGVREYHELYMETGSLVLSAAGTQYALEVRYTEYHVVMVDGRRTQMHVRTRQREYDRGQVRYDARGDLQLVSEYISPLSHTASPVPGGIQLRYRVPGGDDVLDLFYRREPR